jgi:peptide/nickel transport system substrate-binding protein
MNAGRAARLLECAAAFTAALLAAGCGDNPAPARPDALRVAISADIRGTNPGVTRDSNTDTVLHHVVESLVAYSETLVVEPLLAKDVEVSPDGRHYRFTLREGVLFHNGAPMTSAEVKWSWERMLDPASGFRCRSWYDGTASDGVGAKIVGIDTPDSHTVVFNLDRPNSAFLDQMASFQCITAILHPDSVGPDGRWRAPIGTGPYRIAAWRRGEYVDLEKFARYRPRSGTRDGYAGARIARAARIRFVIVPEPSVGVSAIEAGDLDVLPRVPPFLTANLRRGGIAVSRSPQLHWHALLIQTRDPLLRDARLRRAIAKAISADQVAAIATYGAARANPSAIPRISRFHSAAQDAWWRYDPAGARALLVEAGYRGQPIHIQTNRKLPFAFDNAIAIQAMLNAVGINAQLEVLDWATQLSNYFDGRFELSVFSYSARAHPVLSYAAFVGSKQRNAAVQWDDPQARRLLGAATRARTEPEQQRIYDSLHRLMIDDVPIIGLYNEPSSDLVRANVHGYRNWPAGNPRLWGVWRTGA